MEGAPLAAAATGTRYRRSSPAAAAGEAAHAVAGQVRPPRLLAACDARTSPRVLPHSVARDSSASRSTRSSAGVTMQRTAGMQAQVKDQVQWA